MSTSPTEIRQTAYGIALALYPGDASWPIQIERAPDDGGDPDEANARVIAILEAGQRTHVDLRSGSTWHYRARHKRPGAVGGPWTVWVGANPQQLPSELPPLPQPDGRYNVSRVRETARTPTSITMDWDLGSKVHHVHVFERSSALPSSDPWPTADDHIISYSRSTTSHTFDFDSDEPFIYVYLQPEAENGKRGKVWKEVLHNPERPRISTEVTFDPSGSPVVTAVASEDMAKIYLTGGNDTTPDNPTAADHDEVINDRDGTVTFSDLHVDVGNEAVIKLVAEDSDGNLGLVQTAVKRRETGPLHFDATTRSVTSTDDPPEGLLDTITIPAGKMGDTGGFSLRLFIDFSGSLSTQAIRVRFDQSNTDIALFTTGASSYEGAGWVEVVCYNKSALSQVTRSYLMLSGQSPRNLKTVDTGISFGQDVDLEIYGDTQGTADTIELQVSEFRFLGAV